MAGARMKGADAGEEVKAGDPPNIKLATVDLGAMDDGGLAEVSRRWGVGLSLEELKFIRSRIQRPLTDVELQTFGQTWSEHCIHKTFKGDIVCGDRTVHGLFNSYIAKATSELNKPWCVSVFEDNAGLVDFDRGYAVAAKVETHNHPSAVEPFGGAATGVGGVIRDILGVWGEPVAVTDVLCFGPLDTVAEAVPSGIKHPSYIYKGVVAGVGAYGNNMGIPTVSGGIVFDSGYTGNVIVYCGCMGILPKERYVRNTGEGDYAVMAGGRTGRDGIHGVTFASADLSKESEELRSAVQIPNPVVEERLKRATLRIRDGSLSTGVTDFGGGGLSCAAGEMAHRSGLGLDVEMGGIRLKESGMVPWEIWVSESQERMLYSVPLRNLEAVKEIFDEEELEYTVLGRFNSRGSIRVFLKGNMICDLDLEFLYSPPKVTRRASLAAPAESEARLEEPADLAEELLALLSDQNIRSREEVIRTYDHEVRGCTAVKPLQGVESGPNDAAVIKPLKDSWMGLVVSCGMNAFYPDPYWMAAASIEESIRNNTAVGGRRAAILDNFVWGNPEREDRMGSLLRAAEACYDFAKELDAPFISGKDSLYNESQLGPVRPTLLITCIGIIPDVRKAVTVSLKRRGDPIYIVGTTREEEAGGSAYFRAKKAVGGRCPRLDGKTSKRTLDTVIKAIDSGMVFACHDLSDGGLGTAAAEMAISSGFGIELDLRRVPSPKAGRSDLLLFSESTSRFILEVDASRSDMFEGALKSMGVPFGKIGEVGARGGLKLLDLEGEEHTLGAAEMRKGWRGY